MNTQRFTPYGTHHAHASFYGNAGAGLLTQLPPPIPYDIQSIAQPAGGISETTADAEHNQPFTEEEAPVSDFYCSPIPRVTDCLLDVRHPGPGAPAAKGRAAPIAGGTRRMYASCGHGRKV